MIALGIGLFVSTCFVLIFVSNVQSSMHIESMSRLQENARYAYDTLTRDIREAGSIICSGNHDVANVLNVSNENKWWTVWEGIKGYEADDTEFPFAVGTAAGERVAGTDSFVIQSGTIGKEGIAFNHYSLGGQYQNPLDIDNWTDYSPGGDRWLPFFQLKHPSFAYAADDDYEDMIIGKDYYFNVESGQVVLACDSSGAAIFQAAVEHGKSMGGVYMSGGSVMFPVHSSLTATHGNQFYPGNCSTGLGFPTDCSSTIGNTRFFERTDWHAQHLPFSQYYAAAWYVGYNLRGKKTLFRATITNEAIISEELDEMLEGVTDLQLEYLETNSDGDLNNAYVDADHIADWKRVVAVKLIAIIELPDLAHANNNQLEWHTIVTLRSRDAFFE